MSAKFCRLCVVVSLFFTIAISSCAINQSAPVTPSSVSTVDVEHLVENEQYLDISAPAGWNSFKTDDPITLLIINNSEKEIVTTEDFHARIFVLTESGWVEIKNNAVYAQSAYILQPYTDNDPTKFKALFLAPELPDISKSYEVRILISGSIEQNGQSKETVVDYIDIQVFP